MRMFFSGGDEYIRLDINRKKRLAIVHSSKTNYQPKQIKFYELFPGDPRKQRVVERLTEKYDDQKFYDVVAKSISLAGYTLVKVMDDESSKDRE